MKISWYSEKAALVLQAENENDCFTLGKLYGKVTAIQKDCLRGGIGTGEKLSLTVPATYLLNEVVKDR